jgi:hypothetical protein
VTITGALIYPANELFQRLRSLLFLPPLSQIPGIRRLLMKWHALLFLVPMCANHLTDGSNHQTGNEAKKMVKRRDATAGTNPFREAKP